MLKGAGNKKGKQPAKKMAPKHPAPQPHDRSPGVDVAGQMAILAQLEALERAHKLPLGVQGGAPGKRGRVTRQAPQLSFQEQVHQCLMSVAAKAAGAVVPRSGVAPRLDSGVEPGPAPWVAVSPLVLDPVQSGDYLGAP